MGPAILHLVLASGEKKTQRRLNLRNCWCIYLLAFTGKAFAKPLAKDPRSTEFSGTNWLQCHTESYPAMSLWVQHKVIVFSI